MPETFREPGGSGKPIVVGIDGSPSSEHALIWGARQASLTSCPLRVVIAWEMPASYGWAAPLPEGLDLAADARGVVYQAIEHVLSPEERSHLNLSVAVVEGHPAAVLLHESRNASLLVVGSRGHGAFTGMLLGSVGHHLVSHAACPVVILRDGSDPAL